jgi:crotonobetainyl-CoA:carnitine CoA-transferase CaiB-like acyl-CoA transferase
MTLPLDGIKVLEVSEYGFVPSAAAALADWGAEVVRVERPGGDPLRAHARSGVVADTGDYDFQTEQFNRNKRGICIDLRNPDGRAALDRLVAWADVFITNFLPSARAKLRLEPADLFAVNPRLVYAKGHGQGQKGPDADAGGFDSISFWARGAVGHMLSGPDGPPIMQRPAFGDGPSGMFLAGGVAAALFRRERTGQPVVVDVSLLAGAVWTLAPDLHATSVIGHEPPRVDPKRRPIGPLLGTYRTGDGRWIQLNLMEPDRYWRPACTALGRPDLVDDPRYDTHEKRVAIGPEVRALFEEILGGFTLAEALGRLKSAECIASGWSGPEEVLADPQVLANGYAPAHPEHPTARVPANPVQFDDEPMQVRRRAPRVGQHTVEVFRELGLPEAELDRLLAAGAVLGEGPG